MTIAVFLVPILGYILPSILPYILPSIFRLYFALYFPAPKPGYFWVGKKSYLCTLIQTHKFF